MNFIVLAADSLQKLVILAALLLWNSLSKNGSFEWVITLFGLSTLPNTLFIGLPVIQSFYGESNSNLLIQIMVVQGVIWFNVLLAMYEYRAARLLISGQFPNTAGSIASVAVDPEVVSLSDREGLETNAEIGADGKLHVMVRTSSASSRLSMDSFISVLSELNSRATDSFSRKSSKRGGSLTSAASFYGSASEGKFHRNGSNSSRVASFDFEVIAEDSEPSVQQETASQSLDGGDEGKKEMPPAGVVTRLILIIMWRKLIRNPTQTPMQVS